MDFYWICISVNCYFIFLLSSTQSSMSLSHKHSLFVVQTSSCSSCDVWYSTGGLSDIMYLCWSNKSFILCVPQPTRDCLNFEWVQSWNKLILSGAFVIGESSTESGQRMINPEVEAHVNEVSVEYVYSHTAWTLQSWGYCLIKSIWLWVCIVLVWICLSRAYVDWTRPVTEYHTDLVYFWPTGFRSCQNNCIYVMSAHEHHTIVVKLMILFGFFGFVYAALICFSYLIFRTDSLGLIYSAIAK